MGLAGPFASGDFNDFPRCPIPGDSGLADAEVSSSLRDAGSILGTPCVYFRSVLLCRTASVLLWADLLGLLNALTLHLPAIEIVGFALGSHECEDGVPHGLLDRVRCCAVELHSVQGADDLHALLHQPLHGGVQFIVAARDAIQPAHIENVAMSEFCFDFGPLHPVHRCNVVAGHAFVNVNVTFLDAEGSGGLVLRGSGLAVCGADASVVEGAMCHVCLVWVSVSYYALSRNTVNPSEISRCTLSGYLATVHPNERQSGSPTQAESSGMRLLTYRHHSSVAKGEEQFGALIAALGRAFRPVLRPAMEGIATACDVNVEVLRSQRSRAFFQLMSDYLDGELFAAGSALISVGLRKTTKGTLLTGVTESAVVEIAVLTRDATHTSIVSTLMDEVERTFGRQPVPFFFQSDQFTNLLAPDRKPATEVLPNVTDAARALMDTELRRLATAVKASKSPFRSSDAGGTERAGALQLLKQHGIVAERFTVVCTRKQKPVLVFETRENLHAADAQGCVCAECGKRIAEERVEETLAATELGSFLLDKARWLTVVLIEALVEKGIPRHLIVVEQKFGQNEIDCIADIAGELAMFELKDKEFALGNAYSFAAKVPLIQPHHRIIVATGGVSPEAKGFFADEKASREKKQKNASFYGGGPAVSIHALSGQSEDVVLVEKLEDLDQTLEELVGAAYQRRAKTLLDKVLPLGFCSASALVDAFQKSR